MWSSKMIDSRLDSAALAAWTCLSDIDAVAVFAHHSAQCFDLALDARESSIYIVTGFLFHASPPIWRENTPWGYPSSNTPGGYRHLAVGGRFNSLR